MNDAFCVRRIQPLGNLDRHLQKFFILQRAACDALLQRLPFQQFHRKEGLSLELGDLIDGADIGMIQGGGRARLAAKALERLRIAWSVGSQKL